MSIEECSPCLGFLLIIRFQDRKPHTSNNNTQHRITTQICCERNLKLMHNEDAEASVLRPPDTYWTNQFLSFTLKFKTFFSRFVFPSFAFFVVLILVLFVCVCIRFALISSGIGLSHRCSPTRLRLRLRVRVLKSFIIVIVIVIIQFSKSLSLLTVLANEFAQELRNCELGINKLVSLFFFHFFVVCCFFLLPLDTCECSHGARNSQLAAHVPR